MNLRILLSTLWIILIINTIFCDYPWSPNVKVSITPGSCEPTIGVFYPYIFIAYNYQPVKFVRSSDGGITWSPETVFNNTCCDPSIHVSENGKIHLSILNSDLDISYYNSTNYGASWSSPLIVSAITGHDDKCWTYSRNNRVYITWVSSTGFQASTAYISKSANNGLNFSSPVQMNDTSGSRWFPVPLEDPKDSNIVFCSFSCDSRNGQSTKRIYIAKSTNGGLNWLPNVMIPDTISPSPYQCAVYPYSLHGAMAISPLYNDVYIIYGSKNTENAGGKQSIYFSKSTNGGESFSTRRKIPSEPTPDTSYHFQPWINCDVYGTIHIVWYDTRGYPAAGNVGSKNTYYTYSTDRGKTWALEEKISDSTDTYNLSVFGHYFHMTTDSLRIYTAWCERRSVENNEQIYFSWRWLPNIIGITPNSQFINDFRLHQNYPNPFNPSTTIEFDLPKSSLVTLKIYDALGKEIAIIFSKEYKAGKHSYEINTLSLASGIYFYTILTESYTLSRKMVYIK